MGAEPTDAELGALEREADLLELELADLELGEWVLSSTATSSPRTSSRVAEASQTSNFARAEFDQIQAQFRRKVDGALGRYLDGKIGGEELENEWHTAIAKGYPRAYQLGAREWSARVDDEDRAYIARAVRSEAEYASRFVRQLESGEQSEGGAANRINMYTNGLESMRSSGWVQKAPDGAHFNWVLGVAEHCDSCIVLASNSPYPKDRLPCYPRSGCTLCACKCHLEIATVSPDRQSSPKVTDLDEPASGTKRGREPGTEERATVDDLRSQINYHRRMISLAETDAERDAAILARKRANADLIRYQQEQGIRDVPMRSVGDVLTEADVTPDVLEGILLRGLDGSTISAVGAETTRKQVGLILDEIARLTR